MESSIPFGHRQRARRTIPSQPYYQHKPTASRCLRLSLVQKISYSLKTSKNPLRVQRTSIGIRGLGRRLLTCAMLTVTEKETGIEFPLVRSFWEGIEFRCLGAAPRIKKVLFLKAKVYAIALYVEPAKAARELKLRDRGDFFVDADPDVFCDAILDGAFDKILQITMARSVSNDQFIEAIDEALGPKIRFIGASDVFESFKSYLGKQDLSKGSTVLLHWRVNGDLDSIVYPSEDSDFTKTEGMERFSNPGFSRSMFELYMGGSTIIPEAQQEWAAGAKRLLDSTKV